MWSFAGYAGVVVEASLAGVFVVNDVGRDGALLFGVFDCSGVPHLLTQSAYPVSDRQIETR